ncbi:MAG TPA: SxtJ family membrane protein [Burkholderiales bacterium]
MQKTLPLPSNRSFGWTFSAILAVAGAYGVWRGGDMLPWLLAVGALLAVLTFLRDAWLTPLNRAWMKLGELMGRVVSPIVLGVIFFGVFAPVGVAMRLFGRDAMARRFEPALRTYWVRREPPGPAEDSFRDMF